MKLLILDLLPAYISFEKQATKVDGTKTDPSGTPTVSIYEEGGADGSYDNSQITGSPFTCAKINAKTGNYGVLVAKSKLTAGKIYRALFEWTVDGIDTAAVELYYALNSTSIKADVSALALQSTLTTLSAKVALEATLTAIKGAGWTDETLKAIKAVVDAISIENYNGAGL